MSRSYKKTPICKDKNSQFGKRKANHTVRRAKDVPNGGGFKKVYESWNICDYIFMETEKELKHEWDIGNEWLHKRYGTYERALIAWKKSYVRK